MSIRLFNALGTGKVSTNRIAATAGMSPGNLYYHYSSKKQILHAVFDRIEKGLRMLWAVPEDGVLNSGYLRPALSGTFTLMWEHRFFQRELNMLLHGDEDLKERYRLMRKLQAESINTYFTSLADDGILSKPSKPEAFENLLVLCQMVIDFWLSEVDMGGRQVNSDTIGEGVNLALEGFRPYLTTEAYGELISTDK